MRQDAIQDMIQDEKVGELDFRRVVGGFASSNTAHLAEIPHDAGKTVFHINEGDCIREDNSVKHRPLNGDVVIENDWLPTDRPLKIGVTSGASGTAGAAGPPALASLLASPASMRLSWVFSADSLTGEPTCASAGVWGGGGVS